MILRAFSIGSDHSGGLIVVLADASPLAPDALRYIFFVDVDKVAIGYFLVCFAQE
jgi:hypothetical protein